MLEAYFTQNEVQFLVNILVVVLAGYFIGTERESRGKDAGIATHMFVIGGAMFFTFLSNMHEAGDIRIAAQVVTGIGFLGAGIILKEGEKVINLTTAASLWFSAGIGMAIGFGLYKIAIISSIIAVIIPRVPHIHRRSPESVHHSQIIKRK